MSTLILPVGCFGSAQPRDHKGSVGRSFKLYRRKRQVFWSWEIFKETRWLNRQLISRQDKSKRKILFRDICEKNGFKSRVRRFKVFPTSFRWESVVSPYFSLFFFHFLPTKSVLVMMNCLLGKAVKRYQAWGHEFFCWPAFFDLRETPLRNMNP